MSRRVDVDKELPEVPLHDMCHYTAEPVATEPTGAVTFPPTQCRHRPHCSYSAATWRCSLMASEMHNHYIDLLEHRCSPESYFDALLKWDQRMVRWRGEWPPEWDAQMDEILAVARRSGHEPVLAWPRVSTRPIDPSVYGSQRPAVAGVREVGSHLFHESQMTAADTWLMVLTAMYETGRLRAHRIALSLLHHDEGPQLVVLNAAQEGGTAAFGKCGAQGLDSFLRSSAKQGDGAFWRESAAGDPMRDAMIYHHSQFECLDAARNLQNLFTIARMLRTPLSRMGIWVVFVLEHLVSMHIDRIRGTEDVATKMDAVQRLAVTMRHLVTLRRWTAALYLFASVVKAFVEPHHVVDLTRVPVWRRQGSWQKHFSRVENSPWPQNHVLTMLMREMEMEPREFCAYTMPVVYASIMSDSVVMPASMRMRIASLIT
ncbi:hypothetical protein BX070DRAFT_228417 [Coemansia spiralis]|nr:hypothetical protein BX070DRAFT_228417 [Coemansia spiralis]